jgi:hypothetical protein
MLKVGWRSGILELDTDLAEARDLASGRVASWSLVHHQTRHHIQPNISSSIPFPAANGRSFPDGSLAMVFHRSHGYNVAGTFPKICGIMNFVLFFQAIPPTLSRFYPRHITSYLPFRRLLVVQRG